jgi:hypothetical protein
VAQPAHQQGLELQELKSQEHAGVSTRSKRAETDEAELPKKTKKTRQRYRSDDPEYIRRQKKEKRMKTKIELDH